MGETIKENNSPFYRLQRELADRIAKAHPGEKLPPEPELARQIGVARSTLREAMRSFEAQGLVLRRQGAGTFVMEHNGVFETGLEVLESLETIADRSGLQVSMGDLEIDEIDADENLVEIFHVKSSTRFLRISRVINAKGCPAAFLMDILPHGILLQEEIQEKFTG